MQLLQMLSQPALINQEGGKVNAAVGKGDAIKEGHMHVCTVTLSSTQCILVIKE